MPHRNFRRSLWISIAATTVLLAPPIAIADVATAQRDVTSTGYETLQIDGQTAGDTLWCGNDALVYVRTTIRDSVATSGDLMHANVVTGEVRTLRPNIFKFYSEAYTDWPDDFEGDSAGDFFTWPLGCTPDGQWLFYRHEEYDGPVPQASRQPELRALNFSTGQEQVLQSQMLSPVLPTPDGDRLLMGSGEQYSIIERSSTSSQWTLRDVSPEDLSNDYHWRPLGWLNDSELMLIGVGRDRTSNQLWVVYDITDSDRAVRQVPIPQAFRTRFENGILQSRFRLSGMRNGRLVGSLKELGGDGRSYRQRFYLCDIDRHALRCQNSPPLEVDGHFIVWARGDGGVFYERYSEPGNPSRLPSHIIRHDIASGREDPIVADDNSYGIGLRGDISPEGDRLLLGHGKLIVLFLRAPQ